MAQAKDTQDQDMDEGRFAPMGGTDVIEGEIVHSTERALRKSGDDDGFSDLGTSLAVKQGQADLDQLIVTAHKFPRSIQNALDNIKMLATLDTPTAIECNYALPRGRDETGKAKAITGPSIRLAEIIASQWGNCRTGAQVVTIDRENKLIVAEGIFLDLQTNYQSTVRVQRRISDKKGKIFNDDMIAVTGNAAASIALRNAILRGVPKPVWRQAYTAVLGVITGDVKTIGARRVDLLLKFQEIGIKAAQVYAILSVKGENDIGPDELVVAAGFYSAIKNNEVTVEDLLRDAQGPQPTTKTLAGAFGAGDAGQIGQTKADPKPKDPPKETTKPAAAELPAHDEDGVVTEEETFPGDRPTATATAQAADSARASSASATTASANSPAAPSGQTDASASSSEGEKDDAHVPGSEKTDPTAFLRWAPGVEKAVRKAAFTALSRTPLYKALTDDLRDMIADAVEGDEGERVLKGHAAPGETYFMAGETKGENGKRATYVDGKKFSAVADETQFSVYAEHAPAPAPAEEEEQTESPGPGAAEAVGAFWNAIEGVESWLAIKVQVTNLYKTAEFIAMDDAERRQTRIEIWEHVAALVKAGKDPLDFATDVGAFRLWLEWCGDADAIQGNYNVLKREPKFVKLPPTTKEDLDSIVRNRIADLQGAR